MFKPGTVFIIGAGANEEVGMPLGGTLASAIAKSLHFEFDYSSEPQKGADHALFGHIKRLAVATQHHINDYMQAAALFRQGILLAGSIDEYLDRHAERELHAPLGKLAILHHLFGAERRSKLYSRDHADAARIVSAANDTWLANFAHQLFNGRRSANLDQLFDGIHIISFNYDRCLPQYLIAAIQQAYHVTFDRAVELVARLDITYPYGTLGPPGLSRDSIPFGADVSRADLTGRITTIRTFTEHIDDNTQKLKIHSLVANARTMVFLGFGFHPQNIELLRPSKSEGQNNIIIATGFGLSRPNADNIVARLAGMPPGNSVPPIIERELKAAQLLADYRMVLAA